MERRPNIVFIITDQQSTTTLGCYGAKADTPNIDRIGAEGVRFEHHYVISPLCVPSRGSLWTSRYPHQTRVMVNDEARPIVLPDSEITFGDVAQAAGYRTAYFGKWHLGREQTAQHGFDEWWTHLRGSYEQYLEESGRAIFDSTMDRLTQRGEVPFEMAHDTRVTDHAIDFIKQVSGDTKPFLCVVSMRAPHDPYIGPFSDYYNPSEIPIPTTAWEQFADKPLSQQRGAARSWFKSLVGEKESPETVRRLQKIICGYWGLTRLVDVNVGRILEVLKELTIEETTAIVFISDHGDMMGAHGLFAKGLFLYEESTHIPLLMRWPGHIPSGRLVNALTSMIDVVPTILDLMAVPQPIAMLGESMRQLWDYGYNRREAIFMEVFESYGNWGPVLGVRTERYKYNWYLGDDDELYDLHDDPYENINLAGNKGMRDVVIGMRSQIERWLRETGNPSIADLLEIPLGKKVDGSL